MKSFLKFVHFLLAFFNGFKTITLPFWFGKMLGFVSTTLSNMLKKRDPLFDPTYYAVHHVSSNLDFSSEKMEKAIKMLDNVLIKK